MPERLPVLSTSIEAVPPYDFDLTASYATYFRGRYGTEIFENGLFRRLLDIGGNLCLTSVSSVGTIESPRLMIELTGTGSDRSIIEAAEGQITRILGTNQDLSQFYDLASRDMSLTKLIHGLFGLHVPQTGSVFEALVLAILGQQISAAVAHKLRTSLIRTYGPSISIDGTIYYAFPHPESLAVAGIDGLRAIGLSVRKAEYIFDISRKIVSSELDLESLRSKPDGEVVDSLTAIRGVGRWTAEWLLIRALGRTDGFPSSDLALVRMMGTIMGKNNPVKPEEALEYSMRWSPFRTYVTAYLFAAARSGHLELLNPDSP